MNYAQENTIYSDGNWHGYQKDTDYKTYEDIVSAGKVEEAIYLQQLGNAYAEGCENEFKPYIYVLGAGKNVEDVLPIHITSTRLRFAVRSCSNTSNRFRVFPSPSWYSIVTPFLWKAETISIKSWGSNEILEGVD